MDKDKNIEEFHDEPSSSVDNEDFDFGIDNQPPKYSPKNLRKLLRTIKNSRNTWASPLLFRKKVVRILEEGNFVLIDNSNLLKDKDNIVIIKVDYSKYRIYIGKVNIVNRGKWGETIYFEDNDSRNEEKLVINKAFMSTCIVFKATITEDAFKELLSGRSDDENLTDVEI